MAEQFDVAELDGVIASLTKAQREAVLTAQECEARGVWHPAGVYASADKRVRYNLALANLTTDYLRRANRLTPLGLAIRHRLQERQP